MLLYSSPPHTILALQIYLLIDMIFVNFWFTERKGQKPVKMKLKVKKEDLFVDAVKARVTTYIVGEKPPEFISSLQEVKYGDLPHHGSQM